MIDGLSSLKRKARKRILHGSNGEGRVQTQRVGNSVCYANCRSRLPSAASADTHKPLDSII